MPKKIENIREHLLLETKRQIAEQGYAKTTVRSVAGACGLAVGTVYNYFTSKEMMIAAFVLEDWKKELAAMASCPKDDPKGLLFCIYSSLIYFSRSNKKLFSDADAAKVISIGFSARHRMLRDQIAALVQPICPEKDGGPDAFCAQFAAEALISWAMEGKEFDELYRMLSKLIQESSI